VDLRETPGGLEASLQSYLADIFDHDVKIGDLLSCDKTTSWTIKSNRHGLFSGKLIVLVDRETVSSGEISALVVQIEHRGTILGDNSSGMTMDASHLFHQSGNNPVYYFGESVTVSDLVMAEVKSLKLIVVAPDQILLPTAADISAGRDPVMARAAELGDVKLSAEDAVKPFPRGLPHE
jgi:hypothetical protein